MVVNDNACGLDKRGALESIASKLAPTVLAWAGPLVGAGLPAMVVNDYACGLDKRGAQESIASKLAPTVSREGVKNFFLPANACPRSSTARRNLCSRQAIVPAFGNAAAGYVGVPEIVAMECT
ncbi:UNVERIFIED_ORG: hypothetical protein OKW15_005514 [Pseudomonas reinekei]|nr:hypothetical protein [Pseudomonas reinekei]